MDTRVLQLDNTENIPVMPDAHHVTKQTNFYTAHGPVKKQGKLRFHPTIAVIYETEEPDNFIVRGAPEHLDKVGQGQSFEEFATTEAWKYWRCDGTDTDPEKGEVAFNNRVVHLDRLGSKKITKTLQPCLPDGRVIAEVTVEPIDPEKELSDEVVRL